MKVYDLKTNYQVNPLGISLERLTFSWKTGEAKGAAQRSARLTVAADAAFEQVIYDSGEAQLNSCACTPDFGAQNAARPDAPESAVSDTASENCRDAGGKARCGAHTLAPGQRYYWKVAVTDDTGERAVSEPAFFEGGHPAEDWRGVWITAPFVQELHPLFRREFALDAAELSSLAQARLYICGLGLYEVYINGEKLGNDYLAPYFTDYRYWVQYQTYDAGALLREGVNRIDVYLGNGWYKGRFGYTNQGQLRNYYGDHFKLLADLYLTAADGSVRVIATDEQWNALKSPVVSSGIYDGEMYDARMEAEVANPPARKLAGALRAEGSMENISPMLGVPVVRREVLPAKKLITSVIGETIIDFGQEITGWVAFWADAPKGTRIKLQYSEVMQDGKFYRDNLRTAQAEYTYISDGRRAFARPKFTFFGFRYVKVTGMEVTEENLKDFEAWAVYSDIEETGFIETSDEKVNRLIQNTKWSQKDNFLDIPTDCPQRDERLGWTGDAEIFSAAASYHMQTPAFFRKYLKDMRFEQAEKGGAVPYVVPDILTPGRQMNAEPPFDMAQDLWGEAGASVWGDAATVIPWNLYLHYGNKAWLGEQYANMKQWTDFIIHMDETHCGGKRLWTCGFHFGDWLSLDSEGDSREGGTDKHLVASVFYMYAAELTAKAAAVLGKWLDAAYYAGIATLVRSAVRAHWRTGRGSLSVQTQTAYVLGIWFKIFDPDEMEEAGARLAKILRDNGGHLATGFVGTAYLCQALTETGHLEDAYSLLLNEEYPGWLYEVNLGATTIWERWNSLLPDGKISSTGMNSLNHYAYGVIVEWIYRYVCGLAHLETGVGGKRMRFAPKPGRRLDYARAEYRSTAGTWRAGWQWTGEKALRLTLEVPFDCQAEFALPEGFKLAGAWKNAFGAAEKIAEAVGNTEVKAAAAQSVQPADTAQQTGMQQGSAQVLDAAALCQPLTAGSYVFELAAEE